MCFSDIFHYRKRISCISWINQISLCYMVLKVTRGHLLLLIFNVISMHVSSQFCTLLSETIKIPSDPISSTASLIGAFEILSKRLRLIEDIPLKVSTVQALDSGMILEKQSVFYFSVASSLCHGSCVGKNYCILWFSCLSLQLRVCVLET